MRWTNGPAKGQGLVLIQPAASLPFQVFDEALIASARS
jgi:hypothetical protein